MFTFSIQVRMNSEWNEWVKRHSLSSALEAKRNLKQHTYSVDPWWDKVRIRPTI